MSIAAGTAHVVGAGVAGLAAAIELAAAGRRVVLYEAGRHAGGRCRSYFDTELGCQIDNGNHLLLAGNKAAHRYLEMSGALETLQGPQEAIFPFIDAATGERWILRPNRGVFPASDCSGVGARGGVAEIAGGGAGEGASGAERSHRGGCGPRIPPLIL